MCQRPYGFPLKFFLRENLVKLCQDFKRLIWTPSEQNILISSIQITSQIFLFFLLSGSYSDSRILYILKVQIKANFYSIFRCLGLVWVVCCCFPFQILHLEDISQLLNYVSIETKQKSEVSLACLLSISHITLKSEPLQDLKGQVTS